MNRRIGNKICVSMSGGVDSSVAAMLLKERGHQVEALFMKNWDDHAENGECTWEADVEDAMRVCEKLDIPLNTVDLSSIYRDKVFNYFLSEYKNGRTPNPDVLCNQEIKFKAFLEYAETLGADQIATGHYARIETQPQGRQLLKGRDKNKDQSYFLCRLNQTQLTKTLFPIGDLEKSAVRARAKRAGLITHDKKDSTGICFIGERSFRRFLSRYLPPAPGLIKTTEGRTVGEHQNVFYYTLGQRRGLRIGGVKDATDAPWYVIRKNIDENELIVAQDHDHPLLYSRALTASDMHWVADSPPRLPFDCSAKNRYRQADQYCTVERMQNRRCFISFRTPQRALTPGQFIVLYQQDTCLGGGIIDSTY